MFLPKNYYVFVAVFIGYIGAFLASACLSWSSTILSQLKEEDYDNPLGRSITKDEESLLSSLPTFGGIIGSFICGAICKRFGRRYGFLFEAIPSLIAYVLLTFATSVMEMYIARILTGMTLGSVYTVNTMYFVEVAENSNRGLLGTASATFMNIGSMFVLILGPLVSYKVFHIVMTIIPAIFIVLIYFFIPESPYYLIQKDLSQAEAVLKKLRGKADVKAEIDEIKECIENSPKASFKDILTNRALRKALVIGCALISFQQLCGSLVIMSYSEQIFKAAGDQIPSKLCPIILAVINLIMGFVTPPIIDKSGRKILLLSSHILTALSEFSLGLYFYLQSSDVNVDSIFWLPLASLIAYVIVFSIGVSSIPWVVASEVCPLEYKELVMGICNLVCSVVAFILLQNFNSLVHAINEGQTFWLFGSTGLVAAIYVKFCVVETKGKSLDEIQKSL